MTSSEVWDRETAERYDADSAEMFAAAVVDPAVALLADLAGDGPALELAVGTGRIAVPLAARGVAVSGIELSAAMVDQLRRKAGPERIPVVVGDMATSTAPGEFSLVYLVWNSLSNLLTQDEQVACFRNAARHLRPGGRFVVEMWLPDLRRLPAGEPLTATSLGPAHRVVDEYDPASQRCVSHHYHHEPDGTVRYGSGRFRYAWPAELDLMAVLAGLRLEGRYADWNRAPFGPDSPGHVSVWRKPLGGDEATSCRPG